MADIINNKQRLILAIMILFSFVCIVAAQEKQVEKPYRWGIAKQPENSETNNVFISALRRLLKKESNPEKVLILIARLGRGESNRDLNRRRLHNVKTALDLPEGTFSKEKIISTEGERVDDYGRVEVYWNGELVGGLPTRKNSDLLTDCCGPDPRYYPYKIDKPRNKQKTNRK